MLHQLENLFPHDIEIDVKNCQGPVKIENRCFYLVEIPHRLKCQMSKSLPVRQAGKYQMNVKVRNSRL
jgi:hypothetical protein